jgi:uncharacterized membrane protein (DUF2068 family)
MLVAAARRLLSHGMDFKSALAGRYLRIVAIIALLLGLSDASRLLGVSSGAQSPITALGATGFAYLAVFCLARLFAAVGLWIRASWGAVLLGLATAVELLMAVFRSPDVTISPLGFAVRLLLLVSVAALLFLSFRMRHARD